MKTMQMSVSHNVRVPIESIAFLSSSLLKENLSSKGKELVVTMKMAANMSDYIIRDLLDF